MKRKKTTVNYFILK